jgi:signal transduction histidine kinase
MLTNWPIARKLTAMLLMISGLALLFTSAAFAGYQYWSYRSTARNNLLLRAEIIAANSTASLAFGVPDDAVEILSALRSDPHVVAAAIYDAEGAPFARYPATLPDSVLPVTPGADGIRFETDRLVGFHPVAEAEGDRLGTLYLASDLGQLNEALLLAGIVGAGVFLLAMLAAYWPSRLLQSTISAPILRLSEAANAVISRHDYSVRAPVMAGGGELRELTDAFNYMLAHIDEQDRELRLGKRRLEGYAQELEERVAERTQTLEETNQALRHNAASLMVANKELDSFAYSVSHDLRAPLRSIDGFSHVLLEDYAPKLDEVGRDYLGRVRAASQRMGVLIDDLLRLARISRVEMHNEPVDLSAMARQIADELAASDAARGVSFDVAPGLEAWGDKRLLQVALENLIRNSWKYTGKRPGARIVVDSVQVNGSRAFVVRDNGAGFDMKYADKLFGEFQRLHAASEFEGTGVGLATVRRIITRHGGAIWAEGVVNEGASFYFTLMAHVSETGSSAS